MTMTKRILVTLALTFAIACVAVVLGWVLWRLPGTHEAINSQDGFPLRGVLQYGIGDLILAVEMFAFAFLAGKLWGRNARCAVLVLFLALTASTLVVDGLNLVWPALKEWEFSRVDRYGRLPFVGQAGAFIVALVAGIVWIRRSGYDPLGGVAGGGRRFPRVQGVLVFLFLALLVLTLGGVGRNTGEGQYGTTVVVAFVRGLLPLVSAAALAAYAGRPAAPLVYLFFALQSVKSASGTLFGLVASAELYAKYPVWRAEAITGLVVSVALIAILGLFCRAAVRRQDEDEPPSPATWLTTHRATVLLVVWGVILYLTGVLIGSGALGRRLIAVPLAVWLLPYLPMGLVAYIGETVGKLLGHGGESILMAFGWVVYLLLNLGVLLCHRRKVLIALLVVLCVLLLLNMVSCVSLCHGLDHVN